MTNVSQLQNRRTMAVIRMAPAGIGMEPTASRSRARSIGYILNILPSVSGEITSDSCRKAGASVERVRPCHSWNWRGGKLLLHGFPKAVQTPTWLFLSGFEPCSAASEPRSSDITAVPSALRTLLCVASADRALPEGAGGAESPNLESLLPGGHPRGDEDAADRVGRPARLPPGDQGDHGGSCSMLPRPSARYRAPALRGRACFSPRTASSLLYEWFTEECPSSSPAFST